MARRERRGSRSSTQRTRGCAILPDPWMPGCIAAAQQRQELSARMGTQTQKRAGAPPAPAHPAPAAAHPPPPPLPPPLTAPCPLRTTAGRQGGPDGAGQGGEEGGAGQREAGRARTAEMQRRRGGGAQDPRRQALACSGTAADVPPAGTTPVCTHPAAPATAAAPPRTRLQQEGEQLGGGCRPPRLVSVHPIFCRHADGCAVVLHNVCGRARGWAGRRSGGSMQVVCLGGASGRQKATHPAATPRRRRRQLPPRCACGRVAWRAPPCGPAQGVRKRRGWHQGSLRQRRGVTGGSRRGGAAATARPKRPDLGLLLLVRLIVILIVKPAGGRRGRAVSVRQWQLAACGPGRPGAAPDRCPGMSHLGSAYVTGARCRPCPRPIFAGYRRPLRPPSGCGDHEENLGSRLECAMGPPGTARI